MEHFERELRVLRLENGKCPFVEWFRGIHDTKTRALIAKRLTRIRLGNMGDCKPVGGGVKEFRIDFGPGFRVYFAEIGDTIIILLGGGDKSTQQKDIDRSIEVWEANKDDAGRYSGRFEGRSSKP